MVFQNNVLSGAGGSGTTTYAIGQSIRFNDDDSAYLSRTPSSEGNRKKWTLSTWFKLGNSGLNQNFDGLFSAVTSASAFVTIWVNNATYNLDFIQYNGGTTYRVNTPLLTKDPSAWYHAVFVYDSGNLQSTERMRIYLNGLRVTDLYQESQPSLNYDSQVNATSTLHNIGRAYSSGTYSTYYFDGYQTEIHLLDGYAYDPSNFGEFNSSGIWIPKEYTGSYGTNGFKIDGRDSSDLGDDESGNGNDYATSGLAAHDQVSDSPTNNFAVLNQLDKGSNTTLTNGNLEFTSSNDGGVRSTVFFNADKYYIEAIVGTYGNAFTFGISNADRSLSADAGTDLADFYGWYINPTQNWIASGSNPWNTGSNSASASLDVMQMAIDASDPSSIKLYAGINNTYYNSSGGSDGNPSSGTNPTATITGGEEWSIGFWNRDASASNILVNFGQEGTFGGNKTAGGNSDANGIGNFFHSVPTGFKALCTKNLGS